MAHIKKKQKIFIKKRRILVNVRNFSCTIIARIERTLEYSFTKVTLFPEYCIRNVLDVPIAVKVIYPRHGASLPQDLVIDQQAITIPSKGYYYLMVWRSAKTTILGFRSRQCEMLIRLLDQSSWTFAMPLGLL